ncbi:ANM_HP_G0028580.mRNA.1.CDS.1 [Saccharomyces cerevisiae]|nr:ANM_HP_G0096740.mRNA.1.CDS.1 [Saccharomyces cerevisiae]CAI4926745.1 ANM_HP_G0110220.mRNA.1.CDS.1 [Saccharomyces cerevisiae]CAI5006853.1 ANM_HP_G0168270.mRNA.1.CDS.1 [Saccharomyces cerevisiae]CAI5218531.1 ANM_HP_G0028580.mRNA.1.CDS.1 [Saccharomyces cerevisiae]CAI6386058.1 ANM_HP_G0096740.mRNA.1.CDS.1 [Saccharomyces cerevisiae]
MSIVLRKSNKINKNCITSKFYTIHIIKISTPVFRAPIAIGENPYVEWSCLQVVFRKDMVTKKTTFAQLITRLNHFLCQALKRRDSKTYILCRTAVFGAMTPFSPRKSHINNKLPMQPRKKK